MSIDEQLPAAPAVELELPWQRVDPRSILVKPFNEFLGFIPALIGLLSVSHHNTERLLFGIGGIVLLLLRGLLHWLTTRYRITADKVELRTGLLFRQRLSANRDRVRTVEATARFGHRVFGVTAVRVGTGEHESKRHKPMTLDPVTKAEAERLRRVLLRRTAPAVAETPAQAPKPGQRISALDWKWVRYAPFTLSGLAAVGVLGGLVWRSVNELNIDVSRVGALREGLHWAEHTPLGELIALGVLAVLLVVVLGSTLVYAFQFAGYALTREPDATLHVRRGLLTTSAVTIEEARLRGVEVSEPLLLRLVRGARVEAVATGLRRRSGSHLLMPPGPAGEANRVAAAVLHVSRSPTLATLAGHPRRALSRRMVRAVVPVLVLALALWLGELALGFPGWLWRVALLLLVPAVLLGWDRYRHLAHGLTTRYLVTRYGSLERRTVALRRSGIIGWRIRRSFFQRRAGLLTLTATTSAGRQGYHVTDLDESTGLALAEQAVPGLLRPFLERR